ncbi:type VII toxin-antitoxin system MntA family adenylyltransferase antitoxin [Pectobacterium polaris]|uniref:type VII toxin-antitoxin system MntA family adenylyltransferase antitoxin n=1 Tax=Pectobacterium polaris TaxID=2042057 RepID=UPI000BACAF08|nr:nucleotidyltransferase domain-containing protein [Pectobacterium polaris]ASY78777.1 nucleotidyltransferase [Pectobacterium polaris]MCA6940509.1 nucleotidyltransferase domain-containing protein [Pectobacterium polaris]MCA6955014.1 nucleotidyltransferase domain-containing protein [Pectobacterium polaris]MCA6956124.1 nucleotidyltransferase domain-containing protein [Pectobacterium polaris]MCL6326987.1 nucleotidyltransferase domain-containing protein [Pectobacterium polaris]
MFDKIVSTLKKQIPDIKIIYLFGSQATGNARADSDVDIAVMATRALDPVERWELSHQLAKTVDHDVDLIDLLQASTVLKMEIVRNGKLLYDAKAAAGEFEMTTLSMYQHLQRERADIIRSFNQDLKA